MKTRVVYSVLAFALLGLAACNSNSGKEEKKASKKYRIVAPIKSWAQKPEQLNVPVNGGNFTLPSGTVIGVPSSAFVDLEGNPVEGEVALDFKEYHDAADIFLSGIPMEYDSAGIPQVLQTAGMFELYGHDKQGNTVQIAPSKQISISMPSSKTTRDYNFYRYDTLAQNWVYVNQSVIAPFAPESDSSVASTEPLAPIAPQPYDPNAQVIDMKINASEYPELSDLKGLMWQYAGTAVGDNTKNNWIFTHKWNSIKLETVDRETSIFMLKLEGGGKKFQTQVKPVLAGKSFKKAKAEYDKKILAYQNSLNEQKSKAAERLANAEVIFRTVGIGGFGLYNHDKIYSSPNIVKAKFSMSDGKPVDADQVFFLYGGDATVLRIPAAGTHSLQFATGNGNCLVAFLGNGNVAVFNHNDFKALKSGDITKGTEFEFKLREVTTSEINPELLKAMIKI